MQSWSLVFSILLTRQVTDAVLTTRPDNVAATVGSQVTLPCESDTNSDLVAWQNATDPLGITTISMGATVSGSVPNKEIYSISTAKIGEYNLHIDLLPISGGVYQCKQLSPEENALIHIIVLEAQPTCTSSISAGQVVAVGGTFTKTCSVSYHGDSNWAPKIVFNNQNGPITEVTDQSSGNTIQIQYQATATAEMDGDVIEVTTHFVDYNGTLGADYATNVPDYTSKHTFDALKVGSSVNNIQISPDQAYYLIGDEITCTADGTPEPSINWVNQGDGSTVSGAILTITLSMTSAQQHWQCVANNTVDGQDYEAMHNHVFDVGGGGSIEFIPELSLYAPGEEVKCNSTGVDSPQYQWLNLVDNSAVTGDTLTMTEDMIGRCQVWQCTVSDIEQVVEKNLIFAVSSFCLP